LRLRSALSKADRGAVTAPAMCSRACSSGSRTSISTAAPAFRRAATSAGERETSGFIGKSLRKRRRSMRLRRAEDLGQDGDHLQGGGIGDAIEDGGAALARADQTVVAQARQMLGQRRLRQTNLQVGDLTFSLADLAQDHQAVLIGQRLQQPRGVARVGLKTLQSHKFEIN